MIVLFIFFVILDDYKMKKKDFEITFDDCEFVFDESKKNRWRSKITSMNEKSFSCFSVEIVCLKQRATLRKIVLFVV